jgi:predicted HNH restriction endonuclease
MALRDSIIALGNAINNKSVSSMAFLSDCMEEYAKHKNDTKTPFGVIKSTIEVICKEQDWANSTQTRLMAVNGTIATAIDLKVWRDSFAKLSWTNFETLTKMVERFYKAGQKNQKALKNGVEITAKSAMKGIADKINGVWGDLVATIGAEPSARIYDDKMDAVLKDLRDIYKLAEDEASMAKHLSDNFAKYAKTNPAGALLFLQSQMELLVGTPETSEPEVLEEVVA